MKPLLSIVVANYNYGRFIGEALESVLVQCGQPVEVDGRNILPIKGVENAAVELIVVDGGSTDESVEVIKKYEKSIAWWCSEKDRGQSHAFNKGFARARGRLGCWLNADDLLLPGTLNAVAEYSLKHPKCEWVSGGMVFCDADMRIVSARIGSSLPPFVPWKWLSMSVIGGPSSFFSLEKLHRVGGFEENLHYGMDVDLWWRLFDAGVKLHHIGHYFWAFRLHEFSKTSSAILTPEIVNVNRKKEGEYIKQKNYCPAFQLRLGCILTRIWKIVNLTYIKSVIDTVMNRTKFVREWMQ